MPGTFRLRSDVSLAMQGQQPDPLTFDQGTSVDEGFSYTFQLADGTSNESFIVIGAAGGIETVTCLAIVADQAISLTLGTTGANVPIVMTPGEPVILQGIILGAASVSNASGNTANVTVLLAGSGDVVAPSPGTLTTFTGNVSISASNAKLFIQDTDGVWGTAIPKIEFQDSAATVGGSISFDTNTDLSITNTIANGTIRLIHGATTGNVAVEGSPSHLVMRDTGGVWGVAVPAILFQDSAGTVGVSIGLDVNEDLLLNNQLAGGHVRANNDLIVQNISGNQPDLILQDLNGVGTASTGHLIWQDEDETNIVLVGTTSASDGHFEIGNLLSGGNIELRTTSGEVQIIDSDAKLVLQDTDGVWGTAIPTVQFEDNAGTVGGSLAFDTAQDLLLTNGRSGGNIELVTTGGGDFVLTTLPTSDPVVAGALWNNSGVVNVSAG